MRSKRMKGLVLAALSLALALSAFASCASNGDTEDTEAKVETDNFAPETDEGESSEIGKRHEEYSENATLAFKDNKPSDKSAFEYEAVDGQIKITKYIGEDSIIVIPDTVDGAPVTEIGASAFSGGSIGAVYVPDSVKRIAQGAFSGCGGISTVRLPMIGDGGENQYIGYIFGADEPDKNAVTVPPSLDMVILGTTCRSVGDKAFKGAKTLSSVVFEGEIESVGDMAFYQCTDLVHITLEKVVGEIGELAFAFCPSLYYADISNTTETASGAFYLCSGINGIKLNLSDNDFSGRYFGAESPDYNDEFVPASLRSVTLGDKTEKIPDRAFTSCKHITSVTFSEGLSSIGVRAFYACRSLLDIELPESLKTIDDDAFFGCDNLKNVKFGSNLESIGMQAFFGCTSLASADIGDGVRLGRDVFGNCPKLQK